MATLRGTSNSCKPKGWPWGGQITCLGLRIKANGPHPLDLPLNFTSNWHLVGLWFPEGGATMASPPFLQRPRNIRVWGPHGPNFTLLPLVTAWESPWQPYTQMKALVEGNKLNWCRMGHLLWVGGIFEKCRCEHGPKGVCSPTFFKNATNPQQVAHTALI